ncbi:hypothetical protein V6N13_020610 [Hibiscus sabdariffa]
MQRESVVVSLPVSAGSETGCSEIDPPQAYVRGLLAVWSVGICQLLIESDNLKAVKLLNNHGGFIVVPNIVHSIVEVLNWSWSTKLFHIGRGDNCSVDWMSKQANFDDLLCHRYLVPPESVKFLLQQDVAD